MEMAKESATKVNKAPLLDPTDRTLRSEKCERSEIVKLASLDPKVNTDVVVESNTFTR